MSPETAPILRTAAAAIRAYDTTRPLITANFRTVHKAVDMDSAMYPP